MKKSVEDLIRQGDLLFSKRASLMSWWQELALNMYPERASFTTCLPLGTDFAAHLHSSLPLMVRRELGSSIASMTRRKDTEWFKVGVKNDETLDQSGREYLDFRTKVQREAMYDPASMFERATAEADQDWVTFGQCVIGEWVNHKKAQLQYRCFHLRDVAWNEDENGAVSQRHHNVKWTARQLADLYGVEKLHANVARFLQPGQDPNTEINCRRIIVPADQYKELSRAGMPWVSLYVDMDNKHLMDERPSWTPVYIIARWQTVSESQYAHSPAAVAALPDARVIQAMTLTLLEAGEMSVRPPMMEMDSVVQGGAKLYSGGITAIDASHDHRMGKPLQAVYETSGNVPFGMEMLAAKEMAISRAFFLNKIRALPNKENMTATEVAQWTRDWIREALPLFAPLESEYNAPLCDQTFTDLSVQNAFGPVEWMPESLAGRKIEWRFKSPLADAIEREKGQKFMEARELVLAATEVDPANVARWDSRKALKDALNGIQVPASWVRDDQAVDAFARQQQQQQQEQAQAAAMNQGADTAQMAGKAAESLAAVA